MKWKKKKITETIVEIEPKKILTAKEVDQYVGQKLRTIRTIKGFSQTKLGIMTGVTFQQIQKYEKGTNRLSGSRMYQIAQALEIKCGYFFEGIDDYSEVETMTEFNNVILKICRACGKISTLHKNAVLKLVQALARAEKSEEE